ncbi:MAG: response regulator [Desulfobacteraceae bacterium]|jgi:two-component system chemotaxis response regulator CheY
MRALIVEDDSISGKILLKILSTYGQCDLADNGRQAIDAFKQSLDQAEPYDLICMDISMPELDGQNALCQIRDIEKQAGIDADFEVKVIMITASSETSQVSDALFNGGASAYFVKPLEVEAFLKELKRLNLISD